MTAPSPAQIGKRCHYCACLPGTGKQELRPYGPGGAWVCFACAFESPEREQQTEQSLDLQLAASDRISPVTFIGEQTGPRPLRINEEDSDG